MYGVILLLVVAMLSLLITRIATIALTATGMPHPSARFQARSALTARRTGASGDQAHHEAVARQQEVADEEQAQEQGRLGER